MSKEIPAETLRDLETSAKHAPAQAEETCCLVLELRHYLHQPGRCEEFIALFDDYFIEEQERYGMFILLLTRFGGSCSSPLKKVFLEPVAQVA